MQVVRFRYRNVIPASVALGFCIVVLLLAPVLDWIHLGHINFKEAALCVGGAFVMALILVVHVLATADVVVDNDALSRMLWGRVRKRMKWIDVERIRVQPSRDQRVSKNTYTVIARSVREDGSQKIERTTFTDRISGREDLVRLLHHHAGLHHIPVDQSSVPL